MIFGKNNGKEIIVKRSHDFEAPDNSTTGYTFIEVDQITESDAYEYYRKTKVKSDAKKFQDIQKQKLNGRHNVNTSPNPTPTTVTINSWNSTNGTIVASKLPQFGMVSKYIGSPKVDLNKLDIFIIPKLYQYFAFLDCDNEDMYNESVALLDGDNISWVSYKSTPSKNSFWIFCDKFGTFDQTLEFIEKYPADPRYAWVAGAKREFCIRGIPRLNQVPEKYQSNGTLSSGLQFWISEFDDYWANGKLLNYIKLNMIGENV